MAIKVYSDKTKQFYNTVEEANRAEFELKEKENLAKIQKERELALAKEKKEKAVAERKAAAEKVEAARKQKHKMLIVRRQKISAASMVHIIIVPMVQKIFLLYLISLEIFLSSKEIGTR